MASPIPHTLHVEIIRETRIQPSTPSTEARQTPLSILDATVLRFSPTCATWFYDNTGTGTSAPALSPALLTEALAQTLSSYPQWAGRLHFAPFAPHLSHTHRHGRLMLTYGTPADPGVALVLAASPLTLAAAVPATRERFGAAGVCRADAFPSHELLPAAPLALHDPAAPEESAAAGLAAAQVQLTQFACGGLAVAVKLAHPLADAATLVRFAHAWAAAARSTPYAGDAPVFAPAMLDARAAGDPDAPAGAAPALAARAAALPMNRFDWWASSGAGCPPWARAATEVPAVLRGAAGVEPRGPAMPWEQWDAAKPAACVLVRFAGAEVHAVWEAARSSSSGGRAAGVSHLDALLAHMWVLVSRARGLADGEAYLDCTLDVRRRVSPPLPAGFVGSPIALARIAVDAGGLRGAPDIGDVAAAIRGGLQIFDAENVSAMLHAFAHELSSQRRWDAFLGTRHAIVTSWLRIGVYEVDFGAGRPRYVEAAMPKCDGCIQVMEAAPPAREGTQWWEEGVSVSVNLEAEALERLLDDPLLRKYAEK